MSTLTGTTSRITRRTVQISNLERLAFLFMRLSGVALLILAVGHMLIQHVLNSSHSLTLQFVAQQWNSWGWKAYDMLLLAFAIMHGVNGFRNVVADYVHGEGVMRTITVILIIFIIATLLWAGFAIARFDATAVLTP